MKKQTQISDETAPSLTERLNDSPILNWMTQSTKNLLYILIILVCFGVLAYRLLNYWSSQTGYNYVMAENDYAALHVQSGEEAEATTIQLIQVLNDQKDLQTVYDGKLGQLLLAQGDVHTAEFLVTRALNRTSEENGPLFNRYIETTLLIAKEDYPNALEQAKELNQYILENLDKSGPILLPANLIRIAMLQKKLGLAQEEYKTWQDWKEYALGRKNPGVSTVGFQKVADIFSEGKIRLNKYIESREKS